MNISNWEDELGNTGSRPSDSYITLTDALPVGFHRAGNSGGDGTLSLVETLDQDFTERYVEFGSSNMYVLGGAAGAGGTSHTLTLTGAANTSSVIIVDASTNTRPIYLGYHSGLSNTVLSAGALANINLSYTGMNQFAITQETMNVTSNVSGTGGIKKTGNGTLSLELVDGVSGIKNTFSGPFELDAGTVLVGQNTDLSDANSSLDHAGLGLGNVTIAGGSIGSSSSSTYTIQNNITVTSDFTSDSPVSGGLILSGTVNLGSANRTITVNKPLTISGNISSSGGGIIKSGTGTLTLSGNNTYSGGTTNSAGMLTIGSDAGTGTDGVSVSSGATFNVNGKSPTVGNLSGAGNITLGSGTLAAGNSNGTSTFSGNISGTGSFVKTGTGTLTLSGNNTYSGGTTINTGGTLVLSSVTGLPSGGNVSNNGTLVVNANGTAGTLSGTGTTSIAANITLTANGNVTQSSIVNNGTLAIANTSAASIVSDISGGGGISQTGSGNTTITGNYTATGAMSVSAGNLSFSNTSNTRQMAGVVLKMSSLSIASTSVLDVTNHDLIIGNSNLTTIHDDILRGFGAGGSGAQITSSLSLGGAPTFLIPFDASALGLTSWDNVPIDQPNTIVIKYDTFGDASFDGLVNGDDITTVETNFGATTTGVDDILSSLLLGDVNFDGVVNGTDITTIESNFNATLLLAAPTNTPEPGSFSLMATPLPLASSTPEEIAARPFSSVVPGEFGYVWRRSCGRYCGRSVLGDVRGMFPMITAADGVAAGEDGAG